MSACSFPLPIPPLLIPAFPMPMLFETPSLDIDIGIPLKLPIAIPEVPPLPALPMPLLFDVPDLDIDIGIPLKLPIAIPEVPPLPALPMPLLLELPELPSCPLD